MNRRMNRQMRRGVLLARALALAVALPLAGACSDAESDYCQVVEERQEELTEVLADSGPTALIEALPIFEELSAQAPVDIRDEWATVIDALQGLEEALEDAGVDPATYDAENPPAGLGMEERDRIEAAASVVADPKTAAALAGVDQQARDVCKTPLYL